MARTPETPADVELASQLARAVVQVRAPDEMMFFEVTAEAFWEDPDAVLKAREKGSDPLGFGLAEGVTLLTPVVLAVAKDVIVYLYKELKERAVTEGADAVVSWIRKRLEKDEKAATPQDSDRLTSDQIENIRRITLEKSLSLDLKLHEAELLADSIVGKLAYSPP